MALSIETEVLDGRTYYSFEARGTSYTIHLAKSAEWEVYTRRIGLGRFNVGSVRFFPTLSELEKVVKSTKGIAALLENNNLHNA